MVEDPVRAVRCGGDLRAPLHVLLAEDNLVNQRVTRLLLSRLGHLVDTVGDGFEAVEAAAGTPYDVVLMDVQMPGLDGLAATRRIRAASDRTHRPSIVALTASDRQADRAACRSAGMDAFLRKPLTLAALDAALTALQPAGGGGCAGTAAGARPPAPPPEAPTPAAGTDASRQELIGRRLDEVAGPDPVDEDLDLFSSILRSFIERSPALVDDLADAMLHSSVTAVEHQAHRLRGSAANLGGADLAGLLEGIENRSRLGELSSPTDLQPVRAELTELRRSLASVATALESRSGTRLTAVRPPHEDLTSGAPR